MKDTHANGKKDGSNKSYTLSTTIKKKYLNEIMAGLKTSEFKGNTPHWNKRIKKALDHWPYGEIFINLLCGQQAFKFAVRFIISTPQPILIDGKLYPNGHYEIGLGERIL